MADIRPFRALRPTAEAAVRIAALPYDVYNGEEARKETEREPLSFLKIDRGETNFPEGQDIYAPCVYEKAAEVLQDWTGQGLFLQEEKECYYLYELTMEGRVQNGLVGVAAVDDYLSGVIKKHENTREEKERDRIRHIKACNAQTGPIFLAYRGQEELNRVITEVKEKPSLYDFTGEDGIRHRIFLIAEQKQIEEIQKAFESLQQIYIADGHHRCASAAKVCEERRQKHRSAGKEAEFNYFLSVLFPKEELKILDYNRIVTDLKGQTAEEYLTRLEEYFEVRRVPERFSPKRKQEFGMYLERQWYRLRFLGNPKGETPVEWLDVSILQDYCLKPVLGIEDPRTDKRIDFVGGIRGLGELERRVNEAGGVAFSLMPTSMEELFAVADAGLLMPPKSTWFEPKLRSGLLIHKIGEEA